MEALRDVRTAIEVRPHGDRQDLGYRRVGVPHHSERKMSTAVDSLPQAENISMPALGCSLGELGLPPRELGPLAPRARTAVTSMAAWLATAERPLP